MPHRDWSIRIRHLHPFLKNRVKSALIPVSPFTAAPCDSAWEWPILRPSALQLSPLLQEPFFPKFSFSL